MPKNKGKGGKNRRRGKNDGEEKREVQLKEDGQEYAQIIKNCGGCYFDAHCFDNVQRQCHVRGKMKRKVWVNTSDFVLISLRDFEDGKADIILKYTTEEARKLKAMGHLPNTATINESAVQDDEEECTFDFEEI
jgi:translation initiation factor 1A